MKPVSEHWLGAIKKALKGWDPSKHPRGRDGKFLEVGDLVAVYSGPNSAQIDTGVITAGHFADDGRFFVAVKSKVTGKTEWYRPKQIEQVNPKAELPPVVPIPDLGKYGKDVETPWDEAFAEQAQTAAKTTTADIGSASPAPEAWVTALWGMNSDTGAAAGAKSAALTSVHQGKAASFAIPITAKPYDQPLPGDPGNHLKAPIKGLDGQQWFALWNLLNEVDGPSEAGFSFDASGTNLAVHDVASTIGTLETALQDADQFGDMDHPYVKIYQDLVAKIKEQDGFDNPKTAEALGLSPQTVVEPSGLKVTTHSAPAAPAGAQIKLPPGKTPASLLLAINTSATNKGLSPGVQQNIADELYAALTNPSMVQAQKHLAVAMTMAKLGGKQRARYKTLLYMHHGQNSPVPQTPAAPPPVGFPDVPKDPAHAVMHFTKPGSKGILEPGSGNKWVNPPGLGPQSAKSGIQKQIADRMADVPTEKFAEILKDSPGMDGHYYGSASGPLVDRWKSGDETGTLYFSSGTWTWGTSNTNYASSTLPATKDNIEMAIRQSAVSALVQTWAATSNDNNVRSLSLQDLAIEEFNLDKDWVYNWHSKPDKMDEHKAKHEQIYRRFLREMYNNTQDQFKKDGVKYVRLRRGQNSVPSIKGGGSLSTGVGATGGMIQRPMASYSTNLTTAKGFGHYRHEAYVPIERIIGTALTGFGCQSEYEFVVLGGPNEVVVIA